MVPDFMLQITFNKQALVQFWGNIKDDSQLSKIAFQCSSVKKSRLGLPGTGWEWEVIANKYSVALWGDENVLQNALAAVVKILCFQCGSTGLLPCCGTKTPHAMRHGQKI